MQASDINELNYTYYISAPYLVYLTMNTNPLVLCHKITLLVTMLMRHKKSTMVKKKQNGCNTMRY
jgi:hypothetical protein